MRGFPTVLLADDDENDRYLLDLAFEKNGLPNVLQVVRNGEEAIDYLRGDGVYSDREKYPWPSLMLFDLKMPLVDDFEALASLGREARFWGLAEARPESKMRQRLGNMSAARCQFSLTAQVLNANLLPVVILLLLLGLRTNVPGASEGESPHTFNPKNPRV